MPSTDQDAVLASEDAQHRLRQLVAELNEHTDEMQQAIGELREALEAGED